MLPNQCRARKSMVTRCATRLGKPADHRPRLSAAANSGGIRNLLEPAGFLLVGILARRTWRRHPLLKRQRSSLLLKTSGGVASAMWWPETPSSHCLPSYARGRTNSFPVLRGWRIPFVSRGQWPARFEWETVVSPAAVVREPRSRVPRGDLAT